MGREDILDMAEDYFKELGLVVTDGSNNRVCLEKGDGFVAVQVLEHGDREVDIIGNGYDPQIKTFISKITKEVSK